MIRSMVGGTAASRDQIEPLTLGAHPEIASRETEGVLTTADYRAGARVLARMGLSLDTGVVFPQLPELAEFAKAVPEPTIILNGGTTVVTPGYTGRRRRSRCGGRRRGRCRRHLCGLCGSEHQLLPAALLPATCVVVASLRAVHRTSSGTRCGPSLRR
jgi:hypothetical protein